MNTVLPERASPVTPSLTVGVDEVRCKVADIAESIDGTVGIVRKSARFWLSFSAFWRRGRGDEELGCARS